MKKIIIIFLFIFLLLGCTKKETIDIKPIEDEEKIIEETYIDSNEVILGFYDDDWNKIEEISNTWVYHKDIGWPWVFPSDSVKLESGKSKTLWQKYWNRDSKYKFGLELSYSLVDDQKVQLTLLKPSDNLNYSQFVEIYLYDGYNATTTWFDHLDDDEIEEFTVYTSIKITSGKRIEEVISPIVLKVFTYDSDDDFDIDGKYRGNSYSILTINKK